jgi:hypothetical protein
MIAEAKKAGIVIWWFLLSAGEVLRCNGKAVKIKQNVFKL